MRGLCDFSKVYDAELLQKIMQHACQTPGGTIQTYLLSRMVLQRKIPGDFVECGVAAGAQLAAMAVAMTRENDRRPIHAYDSFQGIPHAGPQDQEQPGITGQVFLMDRELSLEKRLVTTKISSCPLADVKRIFESWKFEGITAHYYEGWFQHTLPKNQLGTIAFLRLDGDLAESTETCLFWLYDKVAPGGIVYVDDYGLAGCQNAVHEFLETRMILPELFRDAQGNSGAVYWFK